MIPSRSLNDHSGRHHFRWFMTSNAAALDAARDAKPRVVQFLSLTVPPATARLRLHLSLATNKSLRPRRITILRSHHAAKSP